MKILKVGLIGVGAILVIYGLDPRLALLTGTMIIYNNWAWVSFIAGLAIICGGIFLVK